MMQEKELFQESFREADNWILIINFVQVDFRVLIKNNKNKPPYGRYVFPISAVSLMLLLWLSAFGCFTVKFHFL